MQAQALPNEVAAILAFVCRGATIVLDRLVFCEEECPLDSTLSSYPIKIQMPVNWGSMDAFSHVNNVVYFRYFEDARLAYFEQVGIIDHMKEHNIGPILASTDCRFLFPLTYPDTVHIGAKVFEVESDRFSMEYLVLSETHKRVAAKGKGLIVCFDYQRQTKSPLPQEWLAAISELEGTEFTG